MESLETIGIYLQKTRQLTTAVKEMNDLAWKAGMQAHDLKGWIDLDEYILHYPDYKDNLFEEARLLWIDLLRLKKEAEQAYLSIPERERLGLWTVRQVLKMGMFNL